MNDLHDDLLEMFRRRERDLRSPAVAPERLVARTRRRQWVSVSMGAAVTLTVILGSIAGLRQLGSSDRSQPGDGSQPGDVGPATTKTISGITITYPEGWFAEDPVAIGIEPNDVPRTLPTMVLALTRHDPQIPGVLGCPRIASLSGQVLMTVQEEPLALSGEASATWPVSLRPVNLSADGAGGCYEGWTFMRASWTAAGRTFEARLGFASDASEADRDALTDAYSSMTFALGSVAAAESVTIGSGTAPGGVTWSLTATLGEDGISWTLETDNAGSGGGPVARAPDAPSVELVGMEPDGAFAVAILPNDVRSVVLETDGEIIGDIGLFPVPEAWGTARFAVIPLTGTGEVRVRFEDIQGGAVYPARSISLETSRSPGP